VKKEALDAAITSASRMLASITRGIARRTAWPEDTVLESIEAEARKILLRWPKHRTAQPAPETPQRGPPRNAQNPRHGTPYPGKLILKGGHQMFRKFRDRRLLREQSTAQQALRAPVHQSAPTEDLAGVNRAMAEALERLVMLTRAECQRTAQPFKMKGEDFARALARRLLGE
jgi:hypothetical protein